MPTMRSLPETSHQHHEIIEPHVDRLVELAELLDEVPATGLAQALEEECHFITSQLMPHIEAIESTLYGRLEEVMDKRHSMAPMRSEHEQLRSLMRSLCGYRESVAGSAVGEADRIGLRRVLYRLYAMLKVHLAEEELYLRVLDRSLSAEEKDALAQGIDHAAAEPL